MSGTGIVFSSPQLNKNERHAGKQTSTLESIAKTFEFKKFDEKYIYSYQFKIAKSLRQFWYVT